MTHLGYECVHVPVQAGRVRLFGVPIWALVLLALAVAVKTWGPWAVLGPALVLAVLAALVVVLLARRTRADHHHDDAAVDHVVSGAVPGVGGPVLALSGIHPTCLGCRTRPSTSLLELQGYRIPVCDPCRGIAETCLTPDLAAGLGLLAPARPVPTRSGPAGVGARRWQR